MQPELLWVILAAVLKDVAPIDLGATVVKAVLQRSGVDGKEVGHLAFGHVVNTEARDMYLSRVVALNAGLPHTCAAFNVNRLCGSGLQAIVSSAQSILLGDTEMAIGGGAESMSRAGYLSQTQRFGARMGDTTIVDMMVGALTDPFERRTWASLLKPWLSNLGFHVRIRMLWRSSRTVALFRHKTRGV